MLHQSKSLKEVNFILFPGLNDRLFDVYADSMSTVKSYIYRHYQVEVDEIRIINDISCKYIPDGEIPLEHIANSRSCMQLLEKDDGKKVAIIYFMSSVEEK